MRVDTHPVRKDSKLVRKDSKLVRKDSKLVRKDSKLVSHGQDGPQVSLGAGARGSPPDEAGGLPGHPDGEGGVGQAGTRAGAGVEWRWTGGHQEEARGSVSEGPREPVVPSLVTLAISVGGETKDRENC